MPHFTWIGLTHRSTFSPTFSCVPAKKSLRGCLMLARLLTKIKITRPMRTAYHFLLVLLSGCTLPVLGHAGEPVIDESKVIVTDPDLSMGDLILTMPGWAAGLYGSVGVGGVNAEVSESVLDLAPNIDMIGALNAELRREKWGVIFDGLYIKMSADGDTPGRLLSNVNVGVKESILEGAVAYRVFESDKGWIDLLAGARYMYMGSTLQMTVDNAGVTSVSQELSSRVIDRAVQSAKDEVNKRLPQLLADLSTELSDRVQDRVADRVDGIREDLKDRIEDGLGARPRGTGIGDRIGDSGPVRDAIKEYAKATAEARVEQARVNAGLLRQAILAKAEKRRDEAEKNLAKAIEARIKDTIPETELAASTNWVDPFIGFRARAILCDQWYAALRGDIGGFGIGSELTWNAFAALGYQMKENTTLELGYRHLSIDYESGGFSMDASMSGPYLGLGVTF